MRSLKTFSDSELENSLGQQIANERKLLHLILEHINEVDLRQLYLQRAYGSLYEYLVKKFEYSGSAAMRRIEAARLLRDVPTISSEISEGRINLSQIGELSRAIKEVEKEGRDQVMPTQKAKLVAMISGQTTEQTQKSLSMALDIQLKVPEKKTIQKDESVHLQITLTRDQYEKLMMCRDLRFSMPKENASDSSTAALIETLADQFLASKSKAQAKHRKQESPVGKITTEAVLSRVNKSLTPKVRQYVLNRDQCCQFIDKLSGKKCERTFDLEVDHRTPRWAGGENSIHNLQVLCGQHNRFKYRKEAGFKLIG